MFKLPKLKRPTAVKLTCLIIFISLLPVALPLPLPMATAIRSAGDASQPFPCQHSRCGCKSAQQCWTSCCCTTLKQRLAWAKQRGIKPPEYVNASALTLSDSTTSISMRRTILKPDVVSEKRPTAARSCCASKVALSGHDRDAAAREHSATRPSPVPRSCCVDAKRGAATVHLAANRARQADDAPHGSNDGVSSAGGDDPTYVLSIMARRCQGASCEFVGVPWAVLDLAALARPEPEPLTTVFASLDSKAVFLFAPPDVPPPRAVPF